MTCQVHKALVCGAQGYLGHNLCDYLLKESYQVTGIDLKPWEGETAENFSFLLGDMTDKNFYKQLPEDYDTIFFLTGLSGTTRSFDNYENFLKVNELSLLHLLDTLKKRNSETRVIFPSTRLVYHGCEGQSLAEESFKESKTIYSANKIACEAYLEAYRKAFDIDYRVLRICVPYGNLPGCSYSYGTVGFFLKQAQQGNITLFGDGSLRRTFTHVADLSRQLTALAETTETETLVFNCCGEDYSLLDVARIIADKFHAKISSCDFPEIERRIESGDTVFDGEKLSKILDKPIRNKLKDWITKI